MSQTTALFLRAEVPVKGLIYEVHKFQYSPFDGTWIHGAEMHSPSPYIIPLGIDDNLSDDDIVARIQDLFPDADEGKIREILAQVKANAEEIFKDDTPEEAIERIENGEVVWKPIDLNAILLGNSSAEAGASL